MKRKGLLLLLAILVGTPLSVALTKQSSLANAENSSLVNSLFTLGSGVTMEEGAALPSYVKYVNYNGKKMANSEVKALKFQTDGTSTKATVNYNRVIDLSESDGIFDNFSFLITTAGGLPYDPNPIDPSQITALYETRHFHVKFTDIYDQKNYIQIDYERRQDRKDLMSMRVSSSSHKTSAGWYPSQGSLRTSAYGSPMTSDFTGTPWSNDYTYNVVSAYFNYETKEMFGYPFYPNCEKDIVRDLDNSAHLIDGDNLWTGFTTGEVNMSFEFDTIMAPKKATIYLFALNGQEFIGEQIKDVTPPRIKLIDEASKKCIPDAEVGKEYKLFDASAYDLFDGRIDDKLVDKEVIYEYGTTSQWYMPITYGKFTPDKAGTYTIKYTAKDSSGNLGELLVPVNAKPTLSKLGVSVNGLNIKNTYYTGEYLDISRDFIISGGSEYYQSEVYLFDNKTKDITYIDGNKIKLNKAGYFTLTYRVKDYVDNEAYYKVNFRVLKRNTPLVNEPCLPVVALKNSPLQLPDFSATDYFSFNEENVEANKYYLISEDGVNFTKYSVGDLIIPTSEKVFVKACAYNAIDSSKVVVSDVSTIDIILPENIGEYFYDKSKTSTLDYEDVNCPRFTFSSATTFDFANMLTYGDFRIKFSVPETMDNFSGISILLRDRNDKENVANIRMSKKDATSLNVYLNNELVFELNGVMSQFSGYDFTIVDGYLNINGTRICFVTNQNGGIFSPKRLYASISTIGVSSLSQIKFWAISSQGETGLPIRGNFDKTGPSVLILDEVPLVRSIGDTIVIPRVDVWDALQTSSTLNISVSHNDKTIYSSSFADVRKEVVLDEIGIYYLNIIGTDALNNKTNITKQIKVMNYNKPIINIQGEVTPTAVVGSTITLPTASAIDVDGKELPVNILVYAPNGRLVSVSDNKFEVNLVGRYIVKYIAIGADYSMSTIEYKIQVRA